MKKVHPFSNGSEFMHWEEHNCDQCGRQGSPLLSSCKIDNAIGEACIGSGEVSEDIFKRMGDKSGSCSELISREDFNAQQKQEELKRKEKQLEAQGQQTF